MQSLTTRQRSDLRVLLADARTTHSWTALGKRIHGHVRAGVRLEDIADALGVGVPRVRMIRLRHSGYDPAADHGGWPAGGGVGQRPTGRRGRGHVADATAAGVTGLYGPRRLWHPPRPPCGGPGSPPPPMSRRRGVAAARRDRSAAARRLYAAGVPVAAIAADLGIGVTTVRRDLRQRDRADLAGVAGGAAGGRVGRRARRVRQ